MNIESNEELRNLIVAQAAEIVELKNQLFTEKNNATMYLDLWDKTRRELDKSKLLLEPDPWDKADT